MSRFEMKLPDVGEGVAEAEIVAWLVEVGEEVTPDTVLAEVLTDKATVEVSPPVAGVVAELHGEPGDVIAVGTVLVGIEVADGAEPEPEPDPAGASQVDTPEPPTDSATPAATTSSPTTSSPTATSPAATSPAADDPVADEADSASTLSVTAAPAVRRRAADLGIDLSTVGGTGPSGRIVHADLDRLLAGRPRRSGTTSSERSDGSRVEPVRGVRRKIAERLTAAWTEIPHITYVEAVDVTELEVVRAELNQVGERTDRGDARLTLLPFLVRAMVLATADQPELNAHYDHGAETLTIFDAVHVGIATQTDNGLLVPVVRHAEARDIRDVAAEIARVTAAARSSQASRDELSGSTITITSLGALGGVTTTPILNAPEVAIVGVNKMDVRPVWRDGAFQPRRMINLSSSFDHRMVDGWDAAQFVQRIKSLLEVPALLFADE
jgi:2-oxoisovalerate dehydrogenase E2 component (dihydrolipoyl transacylase)